MEGQTQFQTALKKTVLMFNTLTGKGLTEEEGSIFINLLDMAEGYQSVVTHGTDGMVVSVDDDGKLGVAAVTRPNMVAQHVTEVAPVDLSSAVKDWTPKPITNTSREHIQGYDWQIVVLSREKDSSDSYVVHFPHEPNQLQFEEHFIKFIDRTHYVHVNEWAKGPKEWVSITTNYATSHLIKAEHTPRWEQDDMTYRIRYYDRDTGFPTYKYVTRKPSGNELATYHHTKGFATVQSKVA